MKKLRGKKKVGIIREVRTRIGIPVKVTTGRGKTSAGMRSIETRGNKVGAVQKSEYVEQTREEKGRISTRPEARGNTASAKSEGRQVNPSIRARTTAAKIDVTKV